jgi:hypothetical protein
MPEANRLALRALLCLFSSCFVPTLSRGREMARSAEFLFVVRKREDDTPWIALQPKHAGFEEITGEFGLDLYRGTSLEEAKQLARFLNGNIKSINYRNTRG